MSTSVLGRPVTGEKPDFPRRNRSEQKSGEEFLKLLDAVLAAEGAEAVRWEQYTPYFNDGEVCEFRVHELLVKMAGDDESGDYDDGFVYDFAPYEYNVVTRTYDYLPIKEEHKAAEAARRVLAHELGSFEEFLYDTFGDHAQITATTAGFDLATYSHD